MLDLAVRPALLRRVGSSGVAAVGWGLGFGALSLVWRVALGLARRADPVFPCRGGRSPLLRLLARRGAGGPSRSAAWRLATSIGVSVALGPCLRVPYQPYSGKTVSSTRRSAPPSTRPTRWRSPASRTRVAWQSHNASWTSWRCVSSCGPLEAEHGADQAGERTADLGRSMTAWRDSLPRRWRLPACGAERDPGPMRSPVAPTIAHASRRAGAWKNARARRGACGVAEREFTDALFALRMARRVAVAQRKLDRTAEVQELVRALADMTSGRTRSASVRLARKVEASLRSFESTNGSR